MAMTNAVKALVDHLNETTNKLAANEQVLADAVKATADRLRTLAGDSDDTDLVAALQANAAHLDSVSAGMATSIAALQATGDPAVAAASTDPIAAIPAAPPPPVLVPAPVDTTAPDAPAAAAPTAGDPPTT